MNTMPTIQAADLRAVREAQEVQETPAAQAAAVSHQIVNTVGVQVSVCTASQEVAVTPHAQQDKYAV